jgi:hypothetical protein
MSVTTFQAALKPNGSHSTSTLSGSTTTFQLPLRPAAAEGAQLTVRLKRKGGDPLLMVRFGTEPPSVPRRGKIVADAWDQEAFDAERAEHSVTVALPTGCDILCVGLCNYSAHRRETCYYTVTTTLHVPAPPPPPVSEAPATLRPSGLRPPSLTPAARLFATIDPPPFRDGSPNIISSHAWPDLSFTYCQPLKDKEAFDTQNWQNPIVMEVVSRQFS